MPTVHTITTDDAATVTVSGGTEYDRQEVTVQIEAINRDKIAAKIATAITIIERHHSDWPSYGDQGTFTTQKDQALRHAMRALAVLLREHAREYESEGPT